VTQVTCNESGTNSVPGPVPSATLAVTVVLASPTVNLRQSKTETSDVPEQVVSEQSACHPEATQSSLEMSNGHRFFPDCLEDSASCANRSFDSESFNEYMVVSSAFFSLEQDV
jgi:hypothetical protein